MEKPKIYFVGMHNKVGLKPLCSSTRTGKLIDCIINGVDNECVKTNFAEVEYKPQGRRQLVQYAYNWHHDYNPPKGSTIVLLGIWVQSNFKHNGYKIIIAKHPAGIFGTEKRKNFVTNIINQINQK